MKYTISAVIPVMQYGNLQPSIEVEADTFEEAHAKAMPHIQKIWNQYGQQPLASNEPFGGERKKLQAFVGGDIYYDEATHTYTNEAGEVYLSGSQYAQQFEKPFDAAMISAAMAKKWGADAKDIQAMWQLKSDVSTGFGTALHAALELYGRYNGLATTLEKTTHIHDHPIIKQAVESFYATRAGEKAEYEVVVVDHKAKRAGRLDRLLITGEKRCRIQDYKTNAEMKDEKLNVYWEQLKFYKGILEADGWVVVGLDLFHWNGNWKTYSKELGGN